MQELLVVSGEPSSKPALKLRKASVKFKKAVAPKREPKEHTDWFLRASEARTPGSGFE